MQISGRRRRIRRLLTAGMDPRFGETRLRGWVAEWFKAPVLKTGVRETVPGVRIPPRPLNVCAVGGKVMQHTAQLNVVEIGYLAVAARFRPLRPTTAPLFAALAKSSSVTIR